MADEPIKKFFPDNLPEYIEKGVPLIEYRLWAHRTEDDGEEFNNFRPTDENPTPPIIW